MSRAAGAVAFVLLAAAGCGSYSDSGAEAPRQGGQGTVTTEEADSYTSYGLLGLAVPEDERPVPADVYGAFRRPATPADKRAAAASGITDFNEHVPRGDGAADLGRVQIDDARIVLAPVEGDATALVAAPTSARSVCIMVVSDDGAGSCGFPGPDGFHLAARRDGEASLVFGLVRDGVEKVEIVAADKTFPARVGENGFAATLRLDSFDDLEAIVLHRADGTTDRVGLP